MKKKLVSYLVLACSIFGLAMVGSCKDYEFDVLQDEIDYVQNQIPKNLKTEFKKMQDSIDSMRVRLAAVVSCKCSGTGGTGTSCTVNCDSVRKELDTLYNFIGEVLNDTIGKYVTGYTGDDKSLSAVLNDIYIHLSKAAAQADMAAKADTGDLKRKADTTLVNGKADTTLVNGKADTALVNQKADTATVNPVLRELAQGLSDMRQLWSDSFKLAWDTALRAYNMAVTNEKAIKAAQDSANKALQLIYALNGLDHHSHSKEFFDSIDTTYIKADTCLNRIARMAEEIEDLKELAEVYLDSAKKYSDSLANRVRIELKDSMEKVRKEYQAADVKISQALVDSMKNHRLRIEALEQARKKIEQDIIDINNTLDDIKDRLDAVEDEVADLSNTEKKRITSLYAQSAVNPIFGSFALPIGFKSNILATYYGKVVVSGNYKFPATVSDAMSGAFFGLDMNVPLTSAESGVVGADQLPLANNQNLIIESEGNAGTLYLTVNPNEVEIDSTYSFSFVKSNNQTTNATIGALKDASNDEPLAFGWTKAAASPNGFYKASVTVAADDAPSLAPKIGVTKEELAEIAKDIYHFKDAEPGNVLGEIASALLDLVRGTKLDANAVKVEWSDSLGNHTITSNYDLAVTAIKPLSYNNFTKEFKNFPKIPAITTSTSLKGRSYVSLHVRGSKKIMNKLNSVLDKINKLTNKINNKLDDGLSLNTFVQPIIICDGDDGFSLMSNEASSASTIQLPSSGQVEMDLYLTSLTAELLTPAYKKYIAVVDYVNPAGTQDVTIAQKVNNANEDFNTVLDGDQIIAQFATADKGTYTIYYSTVDYSGVIASGRFYVTVQ